MKCYVLDAQERFVFGKTKKVEVSKALEDEIISLYKKWQVRNLSQKGNSNYDDDGIDSEKVYEPLDQENFVVSGDKIVGYYASHFDIEVYVEFPPTKDKIRLGDYDFSDYSGGSGKVDRGHVAIVPKPDTDTNPYYDEPRFHSQAEYDDYIKWRD